MSFRGLKLTYGHNEIILELFWNFLLSTQCINLPKFIHKFVLVAAGYICLIEDNLTEMKPGYDNILWQKNLYIRIYKITLREYVL